MSQRQLWKPVKKKNYANFPLYSLMQATKLQMPRKLSKMKEFTTSRDYLDFTQTPQYNTPLYPVFL